MLKGKHLVIIGGTGGIGLSAAMAFVREGAKVVAVGNDRKSSAFAEKQLGKEGMVLTADAIEESTAASAIETCHDHFGSFDGLYHVAGGSGRKWGDGPLHELSLEAWNKTLELNLSSLMLSNRAAICYFLEHGQKGSILNLSSVLAFSPSSKFFDTHAYATAKAGIIGFSKSIAAYYAPQNIRVNVLAPALTQTPMANRAAGDALIIDFIQTKQVLDGGRIARPTDLDGAASYFLSDASKFTTGQVLAIDGGWSLRDGQHKD